MTHPAIETIEFSEGQGSPNGRITLCGAWPDRFINIGVETDGDYGSSTVVCASPGEAKELRDRLIGIYPLPAPEPVEPIPSKVTYDNEGNFVKTIKTDGVACTYGSIKVRQFHRWRNRHLDFTIKADHGSECSSHKKFVGTISADCAIQLRDVLNLLYPVSAAEATKPAAPSDATPYTPKVGDRVVVCSNGLSYVAAAAGKEATITAFGHNGYYTLKFDEPVPCDGGEREKFWTAKLSEISPAPENVKPDAVPYKVGDRVIVCDEGLTSVKAAAGREATIISFYSDEVAFPYTIKF